MLNKQEVAHLLEDGKSLWLRVESFGIAYLERYKAKARLAKYLSYATVFAGICTALSSIPEIQKYINTSIPALVTAITAVISQVLTPEKAQRESWEIWKKIESLKTDLASRCRGLFLASNYAEEQTVFQNYNNHFTGLIASDISVTSAHKQLAENNLQAINITPLEELSEVAPLSVGSVPVVGSMPAPEEASEINEQPRLYKKRPKPDDQPMPDMLSISEGLTDEQATTQDEDIVKFSRKRVEV